MVIFGLLQKKNSGDQYDLVVTGRYKKQKRAIRISRITSMQAASVFVERRVIYYGTLTHLLTDDGYQFVLQFYAAVRDDLDMKSITRIDSRYQGSGEVDRINTKFVTMLGHFVTEHRTVWVQND